MRVLIVGDIFWFPHGTGATTRVRAFATGLRDAGADVYVMAMHPVHRERAGAVNAHAAGVYEGVPFLYASGSTIRFDRFIDRRLSPARALVRASGIVASDTPHFDAVIFVTGHTTLLPLLVGGAARLRGAVLLFDGCELPFVYERESVRRRVQERLYTSVAYRWFDGILVISEYLEDYFSARIRRSSRLLHVPILVDVERFASADGDAASVVDVTGQRRFIAYTGEINPAKGTDILVRSFAVLAPQFPDVDLVLTGFGNPQSYLDEILLLAGSLGIGERVRFLGSVRNDVLPGLLKRASVLAIPHPAGEFSQAAFPTKLGEYLASGTPAVSTNVGEIDRYVADAESVYLVRPGDPGAFAERLAYVLSHEEKARAVGLRGREVAVGSFDHRMHGRRILEFITELKDRGRRADA